MVLVARGHRHQELNVDSHMPHIAGFGGGRGAKPIFSPLRKKYPIWLVEFMVVIFLTDYY